MDDQELASGNALKKQIDAITAAQASNAIAGAKAAVSMLDAAGNTTLTPELLKVALGDDGYATLIASVLVSLNTALGDAKTTAQTAYAALGGAA
jgi:hypothetical protein